MNPQLCMGCMNPLESVDKCLYCGFVPGSFEPSAAMELEPETALAGGKYILGTKLGYGGFGITYLGYDTTLQVKVAIKEYYPRALAIRELNSLNLTPISSEVKHDYKLGLAGFLAEARTIAKIGEHPNIVYVKDFFEENGTGYMIMNYLEGTVLSKFLKEKNLSRLSFEEACAIFLPLMDGLSAVHEKNLVHRDISPDNIFITKSGEPKLLDFGSSREAPNDRITEMTSYVKHGYSPIEQYSRKAKQGPKTDIYALAATIYHTLTGIMPPTATDRANGDTLLSPSSLNPKIPHYADKSIMKSLSLRPDDRYSNISEFKDDFSGKNFLKPHKILYHSIYQKIKLNPVLQLSLMAAVILGVFIFIVALSYKKPYQKQQPFNSISAKEVKNDQRPAILKVSAQNQGVTLYLSRDTKIEKTCKPPCIIGNIKPGKYELTYSSKNSGDSKIIVFKPASVVEFAIP